MSIVFQHQSVVINLTWYELLLVLLDLKASSFVLEKDTVTVKDVWFVFRALAILSLWLVVLETVVGLVVGLVVGFVVGLVVGFVVGLVVGFVVGLVVGFVGVGVGGGVGLLFCCQVPLILILLSDSQE